MKNKEKWAKEITEIAINGNQLTVDKNGRPAKCVYGCNNCMFGHDKEKSCFVAIKEWAEEEYIEKPKISRNDRTFLDYIQDGYRYMARNKRGSLFAYKAKPGRGEITWAYEFGMLSADKVKIDFPMVKWENKEPWLIEDLKKLEVVDEY